MDKLQANKTIIDAIALITTTVTKHLAKEYGLTLDIVGSVQAVNRVLNNSIESELIVFNDLVADIVYYFKDNLTEVNEDEIMAFLFSKKDTFNDEDTEDMHSW